MRRRRFPSILSLALFVAVLLGAMLAVPGVGMAPAQARARPADLDITYIEREPRYPVYTVGYDAGVPYVTSSPPNDKTWPAVGETVTFQAHVVNKGDSVFTGFSYQWKLYANDSTVLWVSAGQYDGLLSPGDEAVIAKDWAWYDGLPGGPDHRTHEYPKLTLTINPKESDARQVNNSLDYYLLGKDFAFFVGKDMYDAFDDRANAVGTYSYEDWVQYQMKAMNEAFERSTYPSLAPQGVLERVNLEAVDVVPAATEVNGWKCPQAYMAEPQYRQNTYRGTWDEPRAGGSCSLADDGNVKWLNDVIGVVDEGLIHELSHQLGLADSYNIHAGRWDWRCPGIMGGGDTSPHCGRGIDSKRYYSSQDAVALNLALPFRTRYFGEYMFDVPRNNRVLFKAKDGQPLVDADVEVYAGAELIQRGRTGADGGLDLVDRPLPRCAVSNEWCGAPPAGASPIAGWQSRNPTLTGHSQHDSPFGQIDVTGNGAMLDFRVQAPDGTWASENTVGDRLSLDINDANIAYWQGNTEKATYERQTELSNGGPLAVETTSQIDNSAASGVVAIEGRVSGPGPEGSRHLTLILYVDFTAVATVDVPVEPGESSWSSDFSFPWDTSVVARGRHTVEVRAWDSEGEGSVSQTLAVTTTNARLIK